MRLIFDNRELMFSIGSLLCPSVPLPSSLTAMFNPFSPSFLRSRRRWLYPLVALFTACSFWVGSTLRTQAFDLLQILPQIIQVIQISSISDQQEVALGQQINQELLNSEFRLYRNSAVTAYVNQVGQRVVANSDRANLPYTFQVVEDSDINAFATMGGFVYVTSGLLKAADNEAQLAGVLGHEAGHIGARHLVERIKQTAIQRGIATAAGVDQSTAVGLGVELAVNLPNSRQAEFEADQRGLKSMGRAGYAQVAMVTFMEKLLKKSSGAPEFLSSHPNTNDRIKVLQSKIDPVRGKSGEGLNASAYKAKVRPLL